MSIFDHLVVNFLNTQSLILFAIITKVVRTLLYDMGSFKDYGVLESIPNQLDSELAVLRYSDSIVRIQCPNFYRIIDHHRCTKRELTYSLYWLHIFSPEILCMHLRDTCVQIHGKYSKSDDHFRSISKNWNSEVHKNEINHPFILRWNPRSKNRTKMWLKQ